MPLQHADDEVLRAMRRPANSGSYRRTLDQFRAASPDVAIRTTFIVGFPGETDAQFDNLLRFVEEAQFDRAGAFEYSTEDGTPSADLPNRVPARVKRARKDRLMRLQRDISLARNQGWVGRELEVLVESVDGGNESRITGRSFRDAPEIDGQVVVAGACAKPGEFIRARVTAAQPYDLIAEQVAPPGG
jgi:ribosomal protein S12 methylthiotransferase